MMYVDLNPIRAGINTSLEDSDFTSIQDRLLDFSNQQSQQQQVNKTEKHATIKKNEKTCELLSFKGGESLVNETNKGLPFSLLDYFELIDWTGRMIRDDKKGAIPPDILPIFRKLGVNDKEWADNVNHFGRRFYSVVGAVEVMRQYSDKIGQWWMQGLSCSRRLYA